MAPKPILLDAASRREQIHQKVAEGVKAVFPLKLRDHTIELTDVSVVPREYSSREQKAAILSGGTLQEPLKGTLLLKDPTGAVVETKKGMTLAQIPYFTPRHTFIVGGNEYSVSNQRRVRPGVYTRVRGNEELEATFNLSRGENFRVNMDPAKGHVFLQYGSSNIPLYPVLRGLGINDSLIKEHWGEGVCKLNRDAYDKKQDVALTKLYQRIIPPFRQTAQTPETKVREIEEYYRTTSMDPEVTKQTLGHAFDHVTPLALLKASQKLLDVHRAGAETDDRDSLAFQTFHSAEDFLKERILLDGRAIGRKIQLRGQAGSKPTLAAIPPSPFSRSLRNFMTTAALSSTPTQINPMEILDSAVRVTSLGEGGISSERAVPSEARSLHQTHFGMLDPSRSPESFKTGIDLRTTLWAKKDDKGMMYASLKNTRTNQLEDVPVHKIQQAIVAFPGESARKTGNLSALRNGEIVSVPRNKVDYELPHPSFMFGPTTNLVPMVEGLQGNRIVMGSKMQTQALPLVHREQPLVQVASYNPERTFEQEFADLVVPTAPTAGTIVKVDPDYIYIRPEATKKSNARELTLMPVEHVAVEFEKEGGEALIKIPYDNNFPLAAKTYLHNNVLVKEGDKVEAGQHLADSNFTRDGKLALGKNMRVGYMAYYGLNSNDAVVISEKASQDLTSEHMYKESLPLDPDVTLSKDQHRAQFANKWTKEQYDNLDERGIAKAGVTVHPGDPLIVALRKVAPSPEMQMLGKIHKTLAKPFREESVVWNHKAPGEVVDVVRTADRALVTVRTREPASVGDKISGRYGNKGVIAKILPNDQMVRTLDNKPLDILMTSAGIISRVNPSQIIETAVAKVAEKTGKPIAIPSLSGRNNVKWAQDLLKEHGLSDKEHVFNPATGKTITGPDGKGIMTGPQYIYKLFKSTDTNYAARGIEDYDVNLQPAKGGDSGAKALGRMEINALLAHGARNVLQEASTLKSTKNDEFWRAYQLGQPLPQLKSSFAYDKFIGMLHGAGVKVDKSGELLRLGPLTDGDISKMSAGSISKATMLREKDLAPEKNGLFDPVVTGGLMGNRWSHVDLTEPIVNPTFEEPVRRLLNLTSKEFQEILRKEGGAGIQKRLKALHMPTLEADLRKTIDAASGPKLDNAVKQLKYVEALKNTNLKPHEAYILNKLPILPPVMRPILPSKGRREMLIADANYLYRDSIMANATLEQAKKVLPEDEVGNARAHLYNSLKATFGLSEPSSASLKGRAAKGFLTTIAGQGSPKWGFLHSKVLKVNQDLSGRGTIVPDLTLNMDQIGIPEDMLWTTYQPHVIRRLVQNGYKAVEASQMVEDRHPAARENLHKELNERPLIINRAPTLHRFGILGAYAVPVPGKTIRLNPFMEQGTSADYDGDAVQVHVPVTEKAVQDVKSMTLSNLLFGDKARNELMVFPQHEALLGVYTASTASGGATHKFKTREDAIAAYKRGEIQLHDTVQIG